MGDRDKKPHLHVAAGLVWKKGKVLIAKRPKGSHLEGFWEFPGGKQEDGEGLEDCLERELMEELGLKVRADEALMTVDHDYGSKMISLHVFSCIPLAGEPKPIQCQDVRWVDPAGLKEFSFPPPDREVITSLSCFRNSGKKGSLDVLQEKQQRVQGCA